MKVIRVTLKQLPLVWIDHPLAEGVTFDMIVGQVRASGYFMNETAYLPHDSIASMMVVEFPDGEPAMDFTKARMQ